MQPATAEEIEGTDGLSPGPPQMYFDCLSGLVYDCHGGTRRPFAQYHPGPRWTGALPGQFVVWEENEAKDEVTIRYDPQSKMPWFWATISIVSLKIVDQAHAAEDVEDVEDVEGGVDSEDTDTVDDIFLDSEDERE